MRFPVPSRKPRRTPAVAAALSLCLSAVALAQTGGGTTPPATKSTSADVIFWCVVLLAVACLLGAIFFLIRKRLIAADDTSAAAGLSMGFTLADLRKMHEDGQISDHEYEYSKRKMTASAKAQIEGSEAGDEPEVQDVGDISGAPESPEPPGRADKDDDPEADPDKNDGGGDWPPPRE